MQAPDSITVSHEGIRGASGSLARMTVSCKGAPLELLVNIPADIAHILPRPMPICTQSKSGLRHGIVDVIFSLLNPGFDTRLFTILESYYHLLDVNRSNFFKLLRSSSLSIQDIDDIKRLLGGRGYYYRDGRILVPEVVGESESCLARDRNGIYRIKGSCLIWPEKVKLVNVTEKKLIALAFETSSLRIYTYPRFESLVIVPKPRYSEKAHPIVARIARHLYETLYDYVRYAMDVSDPELTAYNATVIILSSLFIRPPNKLNGFCAGGISNLSGARHVVSDRIFDFAQRWYLKIFTPAPCKSSSYWEAWALPRPKPKPGQASLPSCFDNIEIYDNTYGETIVAYRPNRNTMHVLGRELELIVVASMSNGVITNVYHSQNTMLGSKDEALKSVYIVNGDVTNMFHPLGVILGTKVKRGVYSGFYQPLINGEVIAKAVEIARCMQDGYFYFQQ